MHCIHNLLMMVVSGAQGGRQRGIETLMRSRMGDGPEQSLKELARSSPSLPAAHAEALRACKHAGLIWHAYSHFRKALQVLTSAFHMAWPGRC